VKSFKAGTECTLKNLLFCPDNGETPNMHSIDPAESFPNTALPEQLLDLGHDVN